MEALFMDFWEFLWGSLLVMLYVGLIFMWFFSAFDLFARGDLSGWGKVMWLFIIILLPFLGVALYFIFRPADARWWAPRDQDVALSSRDWQVGEIETLSRMRSQGTITEEEFVLMKQRVLTESPVSAGPAPQTY
jgi:uncharacterized membrane protein